ncbi:group III truncated hemoglobin [Hymenobacter baengnokdamensis]|uniref:group III truncated hemoglobin n=1 Tax=Hymenobacter baengnokdamensis TaxID=2615203 RepID=UPI0012447056|nr:group III truncated hemoglobin [Hymenobacter baengnokdamensis]
MPDIISEADIKLLVDRFYERVNADPLLAPVFNEAARVDWSHHLPQLYDFWSGILLGTARYRGRPFPKHIPLPISEAHFQQWLALFFATVDAHFAGPVADEAKLRARSIGQVFASRLGQLGRLSVL